MAKVKVYKRKYDVNGKVEIPECYHTEKKARGLGDWAGEGVVVRESMIEVEESEIDEWGRYYRPGTAPKA